MFHKDWATSDNKPKLLLVDTVQFFDKIINTPTFSWEGAIGAAKYQLQISTTSDFTTILYTSPNIVGTPQVQGPNKVFSHQPANKLANGTYYWRVIPYGPTNVTGTPSDPDQFTLNYNFVPTLLEPGYNSRPTFTPTLKWLAVKGAQRYDLDYSTDPTFNTNVTHIETNNTTFTPTTTLPNDVDYYWRVRAISGPSVGPWSAYTGGVPWRFRKQWYIKPILLTPTNLYQSVRFPFFSWTPVPGAAYYRIEYTPVPNFVSDVRTDTTSNTFYTPRDYVGAADTWYWRITPFDGNNHQGPRVKTFLTSVLNYFSHQSRFIHCIISSPTFLAVIPRSR